VVASGDRTLAGCRRGGPKTQSAACLRYLPIPPRRRATIRGDRQRRRQGGLAVFRETHRGHPVEQPCCGPRRLIACYFRQTSMDAIA